MFFIESDYQSLNRQQWADFVANHPKGNIFHTPEMVELYECTKNYEPLVVSCFDEKDELVGIVVAAIQKEYSDLMGTMTARAIVWGGPLIDRETPGVSILILEEVNKVFKAKAIYSQFRNLSDMGFLKSIFGQNKYIFEDHLDIHFDLTQGKDVLWKNIHPTRRKQILRGIKRGIQTRIADSLEEIELEACFSILRKVYREIKLPHPDIAFFRSAIHILGKKGYFKSIVALHHDEIVGFRFILCYKSVLYDWYAGSRVEHYDKYPNDILPWEIIKWGADNGFEIFDFGGAGKPGIPYGVRDHKLKFGGTLVNFGRFEKVHKPLLMIVAKMGFAFWKLLKRG